MDFRLDPITRDISLTNGKPVFTEEVKEATAARIVARLLTIRGEWYLDERVGFPYSEKVWVKGPNIRLIESTIRRTVLGTDGVASVESVRSSYSKNARSLTVTLKATATDGSTITLTDQPLVFGGI